MNTNHSLSSPSPLSFASVFGRVTYTYETNGEYFPVVTIQTDVGRFSSVGGWNAVVFDPSNQPIRINVQAPATQSVFLASITGNWHIWAYLWPLEVIGVAMGFVLMAFFLKIPWLMIPASIIGLTGLVLQFCAATGLWSSWAVLWTVEPFAVGLPLLLIGMARKIDGVKMAGIILCGFAGLAFAAMSTILVTSLWITRLIGPAIVLILGILLVGSAMMKRKSEPESN